MEPEPSLWTVVIPAAGRGTRLNYSQPKILYPILGRTILDRLIDLLEPFCGRFVFVLSPASAPYVTPRLDQRLAGRAEAAVISESRGMADSIYRAVPGLSTPFTLVVWGDQAGIRPETIRSVMKIQQANPHTKLTLPVVQRENPYVHYERDATGRFINVLQKREGDTMPVVGESDCGVFAFDTRRLQEVFQQEIKKGITLSEVTKEWNFLPMLSQFEKGDVSVSAFRLESIEETIGVNDTDDVAILEKYLSKSLAK